jgi:2-polyprenyl-3-methyl-5-hydroxy-6-metoxy-1,4-benzoquinol methylase
MESRMTPVADSRDFAVTKAPLPECPICSRREVAGWARAQDVEYFTSPEWFDYYRCDSCDVLFMYPLPVDRLAEIYPSNYYAYAHTKTSLVQRVKSFLDRRRLRSVLAGLPGSELSVLDVGGGAGQVLDQARTADPRVRFTQIVDLDPDAEHIARAAGHEYTRCRIQEYSANRTFDLILMLNLIEHVEDPVFVLSKLGNMLSPQGRMLLKTPNFDSVDARLFRRRSWGGYHCPRHWTLFTAQSFERAARSTGLRVDRISYTQGAPFWAISIFDALRRADVVQASAETPAPFHPIIPFLQACFAAIDLVRSPFSRTSQVFVELSRAAQPESD